MIYSYVVSRGFFERYLRPFGFVEGEQPGQFGTTIVIFVERWVP